MIWDEQLTQIKGGINKDVARIQRKLDRAIAKRKPHAERWKKNWDYLKGKGHNDIAGDAPRINKTRAFVNNRTASFIYKNPRFIVRPVNQNGLDEIPAPTQEDPTATVPRHIIAEHLLNFVMSQPGMGADRKSRRFGKNGIVSLGVSKVGYSAEFDDGEYSDNFYAHDDAQGWLRDPGGDSDTDGRGVPQNLIPTTEEYGKKYPLKPTSERWFWDVVQPQRMLYDTDGESEFRDHDWVACEYYWPLDSVKNNPRFNKEVTKTLKATVKAEQISEMEVLAVEQGITLDHKLEDEDEYARVFEFYDIRHKEVLWLADGCSDFLATEDYPDGVDHSPYVHFAPDENDGEWFPHNIVTDLIPINQEIDKIHQADLYAFYGNPPKWGYIEGHVEDDEMEKVVSPVPNEYVKFNKQAAGDPRKSVFPLDRQFSPPDTYMRLQQLERDFDEVAGQSSESRGRASSKLATGINEISQANRVREDDFRAQFSAKLKEVGKKMLDSIQANMDVPTAVAIEGPDGEMFVNTITPDMLEGDFDVSVDVEDMMPRSTDLEASNLVQIGNLFGQYPLMGADERVSGPILDKFHINSKPIREGLTEMAQMYVQMTMGPPPNQPDAQGGTEPAANTGDLAAQMGGRLG